MLSAVPNGVSPLVWSRDSSNSEASTSNKVAQQKVSICGQSPGTSASKPLLSRVSPSPRALSPFTSRVNLAVVSCVLLFSRLPVAAAAKVANSFFAECVDNGATQVFSVDATPCVEKRLLTRLSAWLGCTILSSAPPLRESLEVYCGGRSNKELLGEFAKVYVNVTSFNAPTCFSLTSINVCNEARMAANECNAPWLGEVALVTVTVAATLLTVFACRRYAKPAASSVRRVGGIVSSVSSAA